MAAPAALHWNVAASKLGRPSSIVISICRPQPVRSEARRVLGVVKSRMSNVLSSATSPPLSVLMLIRRMVSVWSCDQTALPLSSMLIGM